jgi:chromosome segregation ATPase
LWEKALNQVSSHDEAIKDPPAQLDDLKYRHNQLRRQNYEISEKITCLTYDNGQLLAQCHKHEEEGSQHEDLNVVAKELDEENEENFDLMGGISDKLVDFTQVREDYIQCYKRTAGEFEGREESG